MDCERLPSSAVEVCGFRCLRSRSTLDSILAEVSASRDPGAAVWAETEVGLDDSVSVDGCSTAFFGCSDLGGRAGGSGLASLGPWSSMVLYFFTRATVRSNI